MYPPEVVKLALEKQPPILEQGNRLQTLDGHLGDGLGYVDAPCAEGAAESGL